MAVADTDAREARAAALEDKNLNGFDFVLVSLRRRRGRDARGALPEREPAAAAAGRDRAGQDAVPDQRRPARPRGSGVRRGAGDRHVRAGRGQPADLARGAVGRRDADDRRSAASPSAWRCPPAPWSSRPSSSSTRSSARARGRVDVDGRLAVVAETDVRPRGHVVPRRPGQRPRHRLRHDGRTPAGRRPEPGRAADRRLLHVHARDRPGRTRASTRCSPRSASSSGPAASRPTARPTGRPRRRP